MAWARRVSFAFAIVSALPVVEARAQSTIPILPGVAGGIDERRDRAEALVSDTTRMQWTVRPHTMREHPGASRSDSGAPRRFGRVDPVVGYTFNSAYPFGFNDGPVWAGRGVTLIGAAGVTASWKSFSAQIAPIAFVAQNAPIPLVATGFSGSGAFAHWLYPSTIDLPQRFGDKAFARIDPGESFVRLDTRFASVGLTTASEVWGPAVDFPIILGNNAGGFPRAFLGTSHPLRLGFLSIHTRLVWGAIEESAYSVSADTNRRHFATGAAGSLQFSGVPGLELGAARFFHAPWRHGVSPFLKVFEGLLKNSLGTSDNPTGDSPDNQLASVFFRWAPPRAGLEVYGEFGREDHNADYRDLVKEIDHDAAYLIGLQRAWSGSDRMLVFHAEVLNTRISHLAQSATQTPWYVHGRVRSGHTFRGQVLGAAGGLGGGGSTLGFDRYARGARTSVFWTRLMEAELRNGQLPLPDRADVLHAITFERSRPLGRGVMTASATLMKEFNRQFANDAFNLNLAGSYRFAE